MTGTAISSVPPGRYRFAHVKRMEWIKLRSLRSTSWTLAAFAAIVIGLGIVNQIVNSAQWAHMTAGQKASYDPTAMSLNNISVGQLAIGILGTLMVSSEYSSGMIRATLAAIPRRPLVLAAKTAVFGAAALAVGEAVSFITFVSSQAVVHAPAPHATLGQPGVLRAVLMAGASVTLIGLTGLGLGTIIRHTAGSIAAITSVVFLIPLVLTALPPGARNTAEEYLPLQILHGSLTAVKPVANIPALPPWAGLGILCLYPAAALAAGGWLLAHRDA